MRFTPGFFSDWNQMWWWNPIHCNNKGNCSVKSNSCSLFSVHGIWPHKSRNIILKLLRWEIFAAQSCTTRSLLLLVQTLQRGHRGRGVIFSQHKSWVAHSKEGLQLYGLMHIYSPAFLQRRAGFSQSCCSLHPLPIPSWWLWCDPGSWTMAGKPQQDITSLAGEGNPTPVLAAWMCVSASQAHLGCAASLLPWMES